MKAILLTFDHFLSGNPDAFTRSEALGDVRRFVQRVIQSDFDAPDIDALADFSLGVQYDENILRTYQQILNDARIPMTPFRLVNSKG